MQIEIKDEILKLRSEGLGYKAIAKKLFITPSKVRCVVNSKYNNSKQYGICKNCGIRIKLQQGKKKRQFCSDKCRREWWNTHKEAVNKKAFYQFKCPYCSKEFEVYGNKKRVYCSVDCYVKMRTKAREQENGS